MQSKFMILVNTENDAAGLCRRRKFCRWEMLNVVADWKNAHLLASRESERSSHWNEVTVNYDATTYIGPGRA